MSDSSMAWNAEPHFAQKVLIAKAKHETADQLGWVIAVINMYSSHSYFQSWALAFLAAGVSYWMATAPYKSALKKASKEYMTVTGRKPDFI